MHLVYNYKFDFEVLGFDMQLYNEATIINESKVVNRQFKTDHPSWVDIVVKKDLVSDETDAVKLG